jgi:hypothetical protein
MSNLVTIFFLLTSECSDSTHYILSRFNRYFGNTVTINVSEIEYIFVGQPQAVEENNALLYSQLHTVG